MVQIKSSKPTTLGMLEAPTHTGEKRTYLGMSMIGHHCDRYLWLSFRWAYTQVFSDRQRRLFKRGHREEKEIIEELERIGIKVYGEQDEFVAGWGHIKGHRDGACENVPEAPKTTHLLELKTMADKYFKELCKKGLLESNPTYYGQCQVGMKEFKQTRTLFVAVNKNDDAYYVERIRYNKDEAKMLIRRAENIILSPTPVPPPYKSTWYQCKWCSANKQCHYGHAWDRNCRTCTSISIEQDGKWKCDRHVIDLSTKMQQEGCKDYDSIQNLMTNGTSL